ncbi:MAG: RNA methyltransferase [Lachnospiraceae bacterium]|nr:RNA methyltransferase [Lachnospiraceae bacterium]
MKENEFRLITSTANEKIKHLAALSSKSKLRKEEGAFVAEGERFFTDTEDRDILEVYVTEDYLREAPQETKERLARLHATAVVQPAFVKAASTVSPQGVLLVVRMPACTQESFPGLADPKEKGLYLFLENIQDPGNLGTLFRTAEAAGVSGIVLSEDCVDLFNPKTVRATMTSILRMPFLFTENMQETIGQFRDRGIRVFAAALRENALPYDRQSYIEGTAFLIGNEGNGLKPETIEAADESIVLPMAGKIESLNAAMAGGILMYEAARQRRSNK